MEDVALLPGGKDLLVIDERLPALLRINLENFRIESEIALSGHPKADGKNKQYEGIAILEKGEHILLLNEREPRLVKLRLDWHSLEATIIEDHPLNGRSVSGLVVDPISHEAIIVSRENGLRLIDSSGNPLGKWQPIACKRPEGLAIVPYRGFYIVNDKRNGKLFEFHELASFDALRSKLAE